MSKILHNIRSSGFLASGLIQTIVYVLIKKIAQRWDWHGLHMRPPRCQRGTLLLSYSPINLININK